MEKSGLIVGGILGATVALLAFAFVMIPAPSIGPPEISVTNGHGGSTVGEEVSVSVGRDLSLIQIFERSEEGVVRVNIQRSEELVGVSGVGSGFVFDKQGHVITNAHVVENSDITQM